MEDGKSRDWRGAFSFLGDIMGDILSSAMTYSKLLDIEYQLVLGRKNKTLALSIYFDENQFFHLAGLQYLTDRATLLYGDRSYLFQKILSGSITREQMENIFAVHFFLKKIKIIQRVRQHGHCFIKRRYRKHQSWKLCCMIG